MKTWNEAELWQKIAFLILIVLVIFLVWYFANPSSPFEGAKGTLIKPNSKETPQVRPTPRLPRRNPDPGTAQTREEE